MQETWKPVLGWEEHYEVSDLGNLRTKELKFWHVDKKMNAGGCFKTLPVRYPKFHRRKGKSEDEYLQVKLERQGKKLWTGIHRLVWEAFNGPIPDGFHVDHVNTEPSDNKLVNLQCLTPLDHKKVTLERSSGVKIRDEYWNLANKLYKRGIAVHLSRAFQDGYNQALLDHKIMV